jgi:sulfur-oxidizing protein SoxY
MNHREKKFGRRRFLSRLAAMVAMPFAAIRAVRAQNNTDSVDAMVLKVTGGAPLRPGRVALEIPLFADNGNSVSLKVGINGAMSATEYVKSIHLYATKNPRPNIANFYLGPRAGRAQISTRIRLAGSQRVLAVAALSDGSFWSATRDVEVTESACYDAT